MNRLLSLIAAILFVQNASCQITITAADMPAPGDTLRYSNASPATMALSPSADSGANRSWAYPLTPISQGVDTFQTAFSVNPLYVLTVGFTAFGYKTADSIPGLNTLLGAVLPITVQDIYTFFNVPASPSRFEAYAFAANISGLPASFLYTVPDVWYQFPLTYYSEDSTPYELNIALDTIASLKETGTRITRVDGWGSITTPYFILPARCIRVRSVINEVDTVGIAGIKIGLPRNSVEYKWLVNGEHFPALWVTCSVLLGNEVVTSIQYRDSYRNLDTTTAVPQVSPAAAVIKAYPNPASGITTLDIPAGWNNYSVELFDMQGRELLAQTNQRDINLGELPAGQYIVRVMCGKAMAFVSVVR